MLGITKSAENHNYTFLRGDISDAIFIKDSFDPDGGVVFVYSVNEPERNGVVEFNKNFKAASSQEEPPRLKYNFAISGLYLFDNDVVELSKSLIPSTKRELEITDIIKIYLKKNMRKFQVLDRGTARSYTGTIDGLLQASNFVRAIEKRQGLKIGCIV